MLEFSVASLVGLFFIACVVGMIARRIHMPYSVGLVVTGFILSSMPIQWPVFLTRDLVFAIILPPLIFEAALTLEWSAFKRNLIPITWFAIIGVTVAAFITAAGSMYFFGWDWPLAFAFGALISATDPVSVVTTFKEAGVGGDLKTQVEGESLSNDGMATLLYVMAFSLIQGEPISVGTLARDFVIMLVGGGFIGWIVGRTAILLIRNTRDHLIEIALTTIAAYTSFLLAEYFHASGVIACVAAGLTVGSFVQSHIFTEKGQSFLHDFWEFFAFLINSLVFLLVGLAEANQNIFQHWHIGLMAFGIVLFARAISIYTGGIVLQVMKQSVPVSHLHVLVWGSLRGALSLVLATSIPSNVPHRDAMLAVTFFVVGMSLLVQGLTMSRVLRHLGVVRS